MSKLSNIEPMIKSLERIGLEAVEQKLALASGGNLSVRLDDDRYLITASGAWLNRLDRSQFSLIDGDGNVLEGDSPPSSEWRLHARTYETRPDVGSVVHFHPQTTVMLDAMGESVRLVTMDHANYVKHVERVKFFHNGTEQLAVEAAAKAQLADCIILAHHGCMCLGSTPDMAFRRALNLEQAAEMTHRLLELGRPNLNFPENELGRLSHH